jgi:chromosome segregation ATPase
VVMAEGVQVPGTLQEYCHWLEEHKQEQETEIAGLQDQVRKLTSVREEKEGYLVLRGHISELNVEILRMSSSLTTERARVVSTQAETDRLLQENRELQYALEFGCNLSGLLAGMQDPVIRKALYRRDHPGQL